MNFFYTLILAVHNIMRWIVVGFALYALYLSYRGWLQSRNWTEKDTKAGALFTIALDIQLLIGFILYFVLSPLIKAFFTNIGEAISNSTLRFFGMEHLLIMLIAIALAHFTNSFAKKENPDSQKFKRTALLYTFVVILIIAGIPWTSRPLLPF